MKRAILLLTTIAIYTTTTLRAQTFTAGDAIIEANIEVSNPTSFGISYEQGIWQINNDFAVGVGGVIDIIPYRHDTSFEMQGIGSLHWTRVRDFDFYTGLQLGYVQSHAGRLGVDFALGARYYFNSTWAITANVNRGFTLGVTLKL
ncbi:MAG: hypothetical protein SNH63_05295 [Rikenellaceae bacterium]